MVPGITAIRFPPASLAPKDIRIRKAIKAFIFQSCLLRSSLRCLQYLTQCIARFTGSSLHWCLILLEPNRLWLYNRKYSEVVKLQGENDKRRSLFALVALLFQYIDAKFDIYQCSVLLVYYLILL